VANDSVVTKGEGSIVDIAYELVIDPDEGTAVLTCGGEVMWSSESDPDYAEECEDEFIDIGDDEQVDDLFDWLVEKGYAPPGVAYDVVDLSESMDKLGGE
jgi:hypothetical protein